MATTGTYAFAPSVGDLALNALSRLQIRGPMIQAEHLEQVSLEANLLQVEFNNRGPNLWAVDLQTIPTVGGQTTYSIPAETVTILDVVIQFGSPPNATEIRLTPFSRSEYASIPNKAVPGRPTSYWFDRLIAPTITLWPVPDTNNYTLKYYRYRFIQDAALTGSTQPEVHALWFDAYAASLAHRLSRHFAPQLEAVRKQDAADAYTIAAAQNTEDAPLSLAPGLAGYYR